MSKAEKLAAARKKLKEFQQKNKENTIDGAKSSHDKIAVQSSSSNPDQNIVNQNLIFDSGTLGSSQMIAAEISARELDTSLENQTSNSNESANNINIENIFKNVNSSNNNSELNKVDTNYDDTFSKSNIYQDDPSGNSQFPAFQLSNVTPTNYFDNISSPQQNPNITDNLPTDVFAARDFFDNVSNFTFQNSLGLSQNETNISLEAEKENHRLSMVADFFQNNVSDDIEPLVAIPDVPISQTVQEEKPSSSALSVIPPVDSVLSAKESDDSNILDTKHQSIYPESVQKPQSNKPEDAIESPTNQAELGVTKIGRSSTESLRQLSLQINDLIDDDAREDPTSGVSELERRNQELAARLSAEQQKCEQFEQQIKAYHWRVSELQVEADRVAAEVETRLVRELGPLQEQLQLHVQTVGILVGEKTELQAALAKSQQTAKQKSGEVEELQGRVKAAKQLISDLEKEVSSKAESGGQVDKANRELSQELDRLRLEHRMLGKQLEETEEEASELRQKLSARTGDCAALRQDLQDKQSQLALTQLRVQQLSSADNPEVDSQLELLHQHKISLERQLVELQQTLKTVAAERDQASQQYQQYVQQLNAQVTSLATKLEQVSAENEQLSAREQGLVRHVSDLEKQLQQHQQHQQAPQGAQELEQSLTVLVAEKRELSGEIEAQSEEMQRLHLELEEKNQRVEELESLVERLQGDQPDQHKLLAAMESDKVAASRAVGQNQQLKKQLEELQEGFVRVSNNKLELTEKLQYEQHISKELAERLAQQETELNELRGRLEEKDRQIQSLEQNSRELSTQVLQHNQITDRMRHYEAQGHFSDQLQQELQQSKERIQALSVQNTELRTLLAQSDSGDANAQDGSAPATDRKDDMLATLSASVRQLELERDQLLEQLKGLQVTEGDVAASPEEPAPLGADEDEKKLTAMEQLEERFTRTMKEVAKLSDEKQRLEHLVLQLQGETETIGEYIALYQTQRIVLRQRARDKDEQLARLAQDREDLRSKLANLNNLVHRLVGGQEGTRAGTVDTVQSQVVPNGDVPDAEIATENWPVDKTPRSTEIVPEKEDTASKIMSLLTEIQTSNLVDPHSSENFHPCPWCSGQLITV